MFLHIVDHFGRARVANLHIYLRILCVSTRNPHVMSDALLTNHSFFLVFQADSHHWRHYHILHFYSQEYLGGLAPISYDLAYNIRFLWRYAGDYRWAFCARRGAAYSVLGHS